MLGNFCYLQFSHFVGLSCYCIWLINWFTRVINKTRVNQDYKTRVKQELFIFSKWKMKDWFDSFNFFYCRKCYRFFQIKTSFLLLLPYLSVDDAYISWINVTALWQKSEQALSKIVFPKFYTPVIQLILITTKFRNFKTIIII